MVGKAVVHGARGCRGRKFQILAVLLTYFSISSSYVPIFISTLREQNTAKIAASRNTPVSRRPVTPAGAAVALVVVLVVLTALSLVAPFLEVADGIGGIIGLVIVFIGLRQAWHYTRAIDVSIMGPYTAGAVG